MEKEFIEQFSYDGFQYALILRLLQVYCHINLSRRLVQRSHQQTYRVVHENRSILKCYNFANFKHRQELK